MTTHTFLNGCLRTPLSKVVGSRHIPNLCELNHDSSFIFFVNFDHSTALNNVVRYQ
jgi:hypothetical protein